MNYLPERKAVLDTAREIYESKLVPGTWGNVSVRIKDMPHMLITPSGMEYNTMSIEDIVLLDLEGKLIEGVWQPSVETPMHAAIYRNREDIGAIVHVHSTHATVFAVAGKSIPVILEETAQVIGHPIPVAPYAPCGSMQLAQRATKSLGSGNAILLANHGLLGVGSDVAEALKVCYTAEKTAMVALYAHSLGGINVLTPEEVTVLHQNFKNYGQKKYKI
jgi:L-fuculose-phosphate aldolase